jgi:hypothetical protein
MNIKIVTSSILFMGQLAISGRNWDFCNRGAGVGNCYDSFEQLIEAYNPLKLEYQDMPGKIAFAFAAYPSKPSNPNNVPDDWGNTTDYTVHELPKNEKHKPPINIMDVLLAQPYHENAPYNYDPWGVFWRSNPKGANRDQTGQFFIMTQRQAGNLCPPASGCIGQ